MVAMSRSCSPAPFGVVLPHARFCLGAEELRVLLWLWPRCHTPWQPFGSGWEQLGSFAAPRGCLEFPPWALIQLNEPHSSALAGGSVFIHVTKTRTAARKSGGKAPCQLFLCLIVLVCVWSCCFSLGAELQPPRVHCHHQTHGSVQSSSCDPKTFSCRCPTVCPGSLEDGLSQNSLVIRNTWKIIEFSCKKFFT